MARLCMDSSDFIRKWEKSELKESAAAQSHFNDLCDLLGVEKPTDADAIGDKYCFEKGATKSTGGNGFADVWKNSCFGWEYKGPKANLDAAYVQLQRYAVALENPPLLIVSDTKTIVIRTNWTNTVSEKHEIALADLIDGSKRDLLRNCFTNPAALKPKRTRDELTSEAADEFSALAQRLREQGHNPETVAHFVNRLVFCMFAEDVNLLPNKMFERAMRHAKKEPDKASEFLTTLFGAMVNGGPVGFERVPYFNGGLFEDDEALPLDRDDIDLILAAAKMNWADIDPSILGTLFERGLDPSKRSQLGAHYTDRDKIMMIIWPVVIEPLEAQWSNIRPQIQALLANEIDLREKAAKTKAAAKSGALTRKANDAQKAAKKLHSDYIEYLANFRVLDPACGSGNFLYLALKALKDIEHKVNVEAETLGLVRGFPRVGPEAVLGIELNPYAAELARVSIWIGEIQWMRKNGFDANRNPILKPLNNIECRDAVLNADGSQADWPDANAVVGNPPFLGNKKMIRDLGEDYTVAVRGAWSNISGNVDLVTYWFVKAWQMIDLGRLDRAGLVSTNSIRGGANREVLKPIVEGGNIFNAWSDEPWIVDGAAVRVSLICFSKIKSEISLLNGTKVLEVLPDLTERLGEVDLTKARQLDSNSGLGFQGTIKTGPFEIPGDLARSWIALPLNPNGQNNANVLRRWSNGQDVTRRPSGQWIIDFGNSMSEAEAALYEAPFTFLRQAIDEENERRQKKGKALLRGRETRALDGWWLHQRPRPEMRAALSGLDRFILTPRVSKYRLFVWADKSVLADSATIAIARDDETSFGILHSRFHETWSLRMGTSLGKGNDPRYTPSTTLETFPFPEGLSPIVSAEDYLQDERSVAIAIAASRLNELRERWLNPSDLVKFEPEVVACFPDRSLPVNEAAAGILKKRTLTNLYNERPAWLDHAHRDLDRAVAAAYGWENDFDEGDMTDDEILKRLFELNQQRSET